MKLLTTSEAAEVLSISVRTLQELTSARKLAKITFGRNVRYDIEDLERFAQSHKVLPVGWKGGSK